MLLFSVGCIKNISVSSVDFGVELIAQAIPFRAQTHIPRQDTQTHDATENSTHAISCSI